MPRSRAEVRWAFAHQKDDPYAREVVGKVKGHPGSVKALPEHAGKRRTKAKARRKP